MAKFEELTHVQRDGTDDAFLSSPAGAARLTMWFVEIIPPGAFNAGKKAFDDVNAILRKQGYRAVLLDRNQSFLRRVLTAPIALFRLARVFMDARNAVLVQMPLPLEAKWFVRFALRFKRATVVMLLHDIDSLRFPDQLHKVASEMQFFQTADAIICHNASMEQWLREHGFRKVIAGLAFFDYLVSDDPAVKVPPDATGSAWQKEVVFAGSLAREKSGFMYELPNDYAVNIRAFGAAPAGGSAFPGCVRYSGRFPPDKPTLPKGLFGLVWDGPDATSCAGVSGSYLKINSPHKVSLYLACGMPIICWRESAIAKEVEAEQLGIAVSSLHDIPEVLRGLSATVHESMVVKAEGIRLKLRQGGQLLDALDRVMLGIMQRGKPE